MVQDVAAGQEGDRLREAVSGHVQQQRDDREGGTDGGGEGDQAHVLHGGVREHAFVVALGDQQ